MSTSYFYSYHARLNLLHNVYIRLFSLDPKRSDLIRFDCFGLEAHRNIYVITQFIIDLISFDLIYPGA